jgi:hypothetical protein
VKLPPIAPHPKWPSPSPRPTASPNKKKTSTHHHQTDHKYSTASPPKTPKEPPALAMATSTTSPESKPHIMQPTQDSSSRLIRCPHLIQPQLQTAPRVLFRRRSSGDDRHWSPGRDSKQQESWSWSLLTDEKSSQDRLLPEEQDNPSPT